MSGSIEVVKGGWTPQEDHNLWEMVRIHGPRKWSVISRSVPGRTPKSCRLRWCNQLSPEVNHQPFTPEEDRILFRNHAIMGAKWAAIARMLKGRTDNSVKNRFYGLKRKLSRRNYEAEEEEEDDTERTESNHVAVPHAIIYQLPAPAPAAAAAAVAVNNDNSTDVVVISDSESETHEEVQVSESTPDPNLALLINRIVNKAVDESISTLREQMDKAISTVKDQLGNHITGIVTRELGNSISGIVRNEMGNNIAGIVRNEISKLKKH